jgi:hypothetical protein
MQKKLKMELLNSEETKNIKGGEKCGNGSLYSHTCINIEHKCSNDFAIECSFVTGKYSTICPKRHDVIVEL